MKSKSHLAQSRMLCATPRTDDGLSSIEYAKKHRKLPSSPPRHRQQSYLKAASRALDEALLSLALHPDLSRLQLHELQLNGAVLEAVLWAPEHSAADVPALEAELQLHAGYLRSVLAETVRRKRTPHLRLRVIPGAVPVL
jgi:hypothetical protein